MVHNETWLIGVSSLSPSDAYMRRKPSPSLVRIMAYHLVGAKPSSCWNFVNWTLRYIFQYFSKMVTKIHIFSFTKKHLKISYAKWWPFCLGLNVLRYKYNAKLQTIIICSRYNATNRAKSSVHSYSLYVLYINNVITPIVFIIVCVFVLDVLN